MFPYEKLFSWTKILNFSLKDKLFVTKIISLLSEKDFFDIKNKIF